MIRLAYKVLTSKKTRKVAKKAVKVARDNVKVDVAGRGLNVTVAKKKFRVDSETFKRAEKPAAVEVSEWDTWPSVN